VVARPANRTPEGPRINLAKNARLTPQGRAADHGQGPGRRSGKSFTVGTRYSGPSLKRRYPEFLLLSSLTVAGELKAGIWWRSEPD